MRFRTDARDIPFAMIYMAEPDGIDGQAARRVCGHRARLIRRRRTPSRSISRPFGRLAKFCARRRRSSSQISETCVGADIPTGPWPEPASQAAVFPILPDGRDGPRRRRSSSVSTRFVCSTTIIAASSAWWPGRSPPRSPMRRPMRKSAAAPRRWPRSTARRRRSSQTSATSSARPLTLMLAPIEDALNDASARARADRTEAGSKPLIATACALLKLVNSLLDFSRIEAGRVEASFEPTDLAQLTAELASNFEFRDRAEPGWSCEIDCPALTQPVYVDRDMWEKIVLNLLSNAFKFTFEGEIAVRDARVAPTGMRREMTVRDTGVGIPASELPRLFERFHRVEGQKSRSFEGSGIGLALVQELVKLHGGTIRAESEIGRGAAFIVSLPFGTRIYRRRGSAPGARRRRPRCGPTPMSRKRLRWLPQSGADWPDQPADRADEHDLICISASRPDGARVLVADDNADMRSYMRPAARNAVGRRSGVRRYCRARGDPRPQARSRPDRRHDAGS